MQRPGTVFVLLVLILSACSSEAQELPNQTERLDVQGALARARSSREWPKSTSLDTLQTIYRSRAFSPLWARAGSLTSQASAIARLLQAAEEYGLQSQDYVSVPASLPERPPAAQPTLKGARLERLADYDIRLTATLVRFLTDVHFGRVDPRRAGFDLQVARPSLDFDLLLEQLSSAEDARSVIATIEPQFYHYVLLEQALARYRLLQRGRRSSEHATAVYATRIRKIELTLERWRWLPAFDSPPIIVNIPQFRLFAFRSTADRKAEIMQMDVIVGRTYPKLHTPVFAADLKYVIFRPYWDVPASITRTEMIPAMRARPDYLRAQHLEIIRGWGDSATIVDPSPQAIQELEAGRLRLRQQPGPDNALGLVKFMLPNPYNVYLHATPAQRLFSRSRRAFSHGCIRVSDPVALAAYVLRDTPEGWTPGAVAKAMQASHSSRVDLAKPIRVMILYGTALALEDGSTSFFPDIYGEDRKLERLLGLPRVVTP